MSDSAGHFDDRESFLVAQAALDVVRQDSGKFPDDDAVWEAFIDWRGRGEADYLRRIRAGGQYVFYSVLQDLYGFAESVCGRNVTFEVGRHLAETLLERHVADLLQSTLGEIETLSGQIMWLLNQFIASTCEGIYSLQDDPCPQANVLALRLAYTDQEQMVDYLRRSGHEPETAFANSFHVFKGAVGDLLGHVVHDFAPEQFQTELRPLNGRLAIEFQPHNRFHSENLIEILLDYVRRLRARQEPQAGPTVVESDHHVSAAMQATWESVCKAAACDETLLLCGESGTGKSYHARMIHDMSERRNGPFVEVGLLSDVGSDNLVQSNLFGHVQGAFTGANEEKQGLFALAHNGTIFLDEIGDASGELQAKLLRAIEGKSFKMLGGVRDISVDVRIIAATNKDLPALVRQGSFREDLYYRLNVIEIRFPALRDRAEDMPALVRTLFEKIRRETNKPDKHLSEEAARVLCGQEWSGNVRELENALRRAVAFCDSPEIRPEDLSAQLRVRAGGRTVSDRQSSTGVIDSDALRNALATRPRGPVTESSEYPGHIDYARKEYLRVLIEHYHGDLHLIAEHWDRSSEHTLRKLIRRFGLTDHLRTARDNRP